MVVGCNADTGSSDASEETSKKPKTTAPHREATHTRTTPNIAPPPRRARPPQPVPPSPPAPIHHSSDPCAKDNIEANRRNLDSSDPNLVADAQWKLGSCGLVPETGTECTAEQHRVIESELVLRHGSGLIGTAEIIHDEEELCGGLPPKWVHNTH